jgi:hypothetical protein
MGLSFTALLQLSEREEYVPPPNMPPELKDDIELVAIKEKQMVGKLPVLHP